MIKLQTNKKRGITFIALSVTIALVAAGVCFVSMGVVFKKVPVLVAKDEIAAGDPLTREMFDQIYIPVGGLPEDTLKPNTPMEGWISSKGMLKGDILRETNTVDMQDRDLSVLSTRLSTLKDRDLVAVDIPVESLKGMIGGMKAWDSVAIGVAWPDKDKEMALNTKNPQYVTEIIVESAVVVGLKKDQEGGSGALIVGLDSAQFLKYMESKEKGKIYVALHPLGFGDKKAMK